MADGRAVIPRCIFNPPSETRNPPCFLLHRDACAVGNAADDFRDVAGGFHVEYDDRDLPLHAEREGGEVHDLELLGDRLAERQVLVALGVLVLLGVVKKGLPVPATKMTTRPFSR